MKIDYSKLRPGMIIGTTDMSPFAITTRITNAGIKNAFNPNVCTHIAIVCKEHDLFYLMEMALPKIREADCHKYEHGQFGNHIVFAAMPFDIDDYTLQEKANDFLLESHRIGVKYDIKELFKFWGFHTYNDKKKLICSDLARNMMWQLNIKYPLEWDSIVSPWDEQVYFTHTEKLVDIFK
jgi:hypothetical protein